MPLNSQTGPLARPCTLRVAVSVTWKIFDDPPPAARPAGAAAGGVGAWAAALPATAAAAAPAPAIRILVRSDTKVRSAPARLESSAMVVSPRQPLSTGSDLAARSPFSL